MNQPAGRTPLLSLFDRNCWYAVFAWFGIVTLMQLSGQAQGGQLGFWGVIFVLIVTIVRLILLAEEFRHRGLKRLRQASYGLILLLGIIVTIQLWVHHRL